jgi:hypothetical protein
LWKVFRDRVSQTLCLGWFQTSILLISASWVAGITGVSHWCLASRIEFNLSFIFHSTLEEVCWYAMLYFGFLSYGAVVVILYNSVWKTEQLIFPFWKMNEHLYNVRNK